MYNVCLSENTWRDTDSQVYAQANYLRQMIHTELIDHTRNFTVAAAICVADNRTQTYFFAELSSKEQNITVQCSMSVARMPATRWSVREVKE